MKFTEGYWLRSERANAVYAMHAFKAWEIPGGMRVLAPGKPMSVRKDELDVSTITVEFTSPAPNVIAVRSWHYEGYEVAEARFGTRLEPQEVAVEIRDDEAVMTAGAVTVRVNRNLWGYQFEADGKVLTGCGFRNLGYMRWDKKYSTMLPGDRYLTEDCSNYMVTELSLRPGELVYGLGERFTAFAKNGQVVETWNEDGGTSSQVAYKSIPFYLTNKGYGIYVDHAGDVSFEVASEKVEYVGFSVPGEELRYCFIYGPSPAKILEAYTGITGRPALPPAWSFGLWLSTSFTTNYDEATTQSFIDGMAERDIPLSVFYFDVFWMRPFHWCDFEWDGSVFPDPRGMLQRYRERGLKIAIWLNPYVAQGSAFFREGVAGGYFLRRADGRGVKQIDSWQPGMALVDFTNPDACRWFAAKLETLLDMGVDAVKADFGERIPLDVIYHNGADPRSMHNYYAYLYSRCVFELLERKKGKGQAVIFARSATVGSQQFPLHWSGDCSASYASMAETLRGGLSLALCGFAFWSHDISGFEQTASADLYKRWVAFGMLSSHSRLHGSTSYRVPWLFDEESTDVVRLFVRLKCRLMPYIFRMAVEARDTGSPVMRPMVFEFPEDPAAAQLDMQYMLGGSLLVAPVFSEEGHADYYLPEGRWTDYFTGEIKAGGRWYGGTYDYLSLPLYVRPCTLLALGAVDSRPDYEYAQGAELRLYELGEGQTAVCEVPTTTGEVALRAVAERKKGLLSIDLSRRLSEGCIVLCGIGSIASVDGGTAKARGADTVIVPQGTRVTVKL
jgi:alpha-D-xyloside xylohydrolase